MSAGRLSYTPRRASSDRLVSVHSFSVAVLPLCRFRDRQLNSGVGRYAGHFTRRIIPAWLPLFKRKKTGQFYP